jgi:hypothetical protein
MLSRDAGQTGPAHVWKYAAKVTNKQTNKQKQKQKQKQKKRSMTRTRVRERKKQKQFAFGLLLVCFKECENTTAKGKGCV